MQLTRRRLFVVTLIVLVAIVAGAVAWRVRNSVPSPGSDVYEQTTRAFYHGLAALEVGLLDDARQQFSRATTLVDREPASWANLGLSQLRLGELEAAVEPIERALSLAPDNPDVVLLAARMETARGRLDEGVARLREAVKLDTTGLRARFALAEELSRLGNNEADTEAMTLFDELAMRSPSNLAIHMDRARQAAKLRDAARLRESVEAIGRDSATWSEQAKQQFAVAQKAAQDGNFDDAPRATTILRNVLAPVPAFSESLAEVRTPAELIAEPFDRFLVLASPPSTPATPDLSLAYASEPVGDTTGDGPSVALAFPLSIDGSAALLESDAATLRRLDRPTAWAREPRAPEPPTHSGIAALDWNHDFRADIAVAQSGVRLLSQNADGTFTDAAVQISPQPLSSYDASGVWPADVEMDGDLDLVLALRNGAVVVLRNNGDGSARELRPFAELARVRAFAWADLDRDADPDAVFLDESGSIHVFVNRQAGVFARMDGSIGPGSFVALTIADLNADGAMDLVTIDGGGVLRRLSRAGNAWTATEIARWPDLKDASPATHRLFGADLDNNGALDVIASGVGTTRIWLAGTDYQLQPLTTPTPQGDVFSVMDLNADGFLDLFGISGRRSTRWLGRGMAGYHWKTIRPRAQQNAGDQRINAFGVGGDIQVRSGLLVQTQVLAGAPVHFGLGTRTAIDVARIVWPNGVAQAEFGAGVDDAIVAEQRLKGSCPWVFAWDGTEMGFVTDFLWRSPLGLRINAQDTAGVTQTEDWVKLSGAQLKPRDGVYDIRITAELWETHFFDHVSLMVVDHPAGTQVFVDERFSATRPPSLAVQAMKQPAPVSRAWDHRGQDVTDLVARQDGRYLASFSRGPYQGIAEDHFAEFEVRLKPDTTFKDLVLIAQGWIYPTDSSINMAIGQGGRVAPKGLSLEALGRDGQWTIVESDLGFPAGKNKTMLVDLGRVPVGSTRLRLHTNLEISWDLLAVAERTDVAVRLKRIPVSLAELRFRGYSETRSERGEEPETPSYERLANTTQRWRDLVGYYTRFGNVNALLAGVDDRYVIMNAGDELRLQFEAQEPPPASWERDFVLIGDGWEKDGDYNTGFSETVVPLPSHDQPNYGAGVTSLALGDDPVYRRHRGDWEEYHTRYVTPRAFVRGLRRN